MVESAMGGDVPFLFLTPATDPAGTATPEDLGEEARLLVRAVEDFAEREVRPHMARLLARDPEITRTLFRKAAELGLFRAEVPEADGGLELGVLAVTSMLSSRAQLGPLDTMIAIHQGVGTLPLAYFGTREQKARYLGGCMDGSQVAAFALTEPSSGSDAMSIRTRAELDPAGAHYVLNGAKQWVTNAGWADLFVLFAKVDGQRFTAFIVDRDTPGLIVTEPKKLLGLQGASVCALSLDDVRVPVGNVLGEVGKGYKVAFCTLNMGRLKLAASAATGAKLALEAAVRHAAQRIQFGVPIARFGLVQRKLADMAARAFAAESVAYRTAGLVDDAFGELGSRGSVTSDARLEALAQLSAECALAKVYASEAYHASADEAVQVLGGDGFSDDHPVSRMYRDSRVTRIWEGTNEICRLHAQRTVVKTLAGGGPDARALPGCSMVLEQLDAARGRRARNGIHGKAAEDLEAVDGLKQVYFMLLEDVMATAGTEKLKGPDRQALLGSLADVAMEAFVAESVALRVAKLEGRCTPESGEVRADLVALLLDRASDRIHSEARGIMAEIRPGGEGARRLAELDALLPEPRALIETRARVAGWLVARGGLLPGEAS
ncbi:MAG TPA: acyl-CoA dehydrogenase family protein [Longimicrobiales bacterium]|nr:acyl-CoA dehydrogenase family protein [Longimicrobiales bacterium]